MQLVENKQYRRNVRARAFSLIELLVVMAIISILLVAAIPIFSNSSNSARQASREIVKAHLQQARAHAIASGTATAIAIPVLNSGEALGARGISLFEVENQAGNYIPLKDSAGEDVLLQRWDKLPGNFHFLSGSQISSARKTIVDEPQTLATNYKSQSLDCHFIVFAPNGQIVRPASGTPILIALAQTARQGNNLTLTQKSAGKPVFDIFQVNRLTGRTRFIDP